MGKLSLLIALLAGTASAAVPFKNGTAFALKDVPGELVVERRAGEPVRFVLEENGTTGYQWAAEWNTNECEVILNHRGAAEKNERGEQLCGAAGTLDVAVTSKIYTPARIEFAYRRPWEKGVKPIHALKLIVYTVGEPKSPHKDILAFESVKNAMKLRQLLSLLAFQVGKEVSLTEVGSRLGLARQTVERYLDLLAKCFIGNVEDDDKAILA